MVNVFSAKEFQFPYTDVRFSGQANDERILYIGREAEIMRWLKLAFVVLATVILFVVGQLILEILGRLINQSVGGWQLLVTLLSIIFGGIGLWWVHTTWQKSLFFITNRRLSKFIYVTPWNRYNLSVTLDMVEDTGAYSRGYFEALFKIGTFSARSAAGNREEKYFFVNHVKFAEDLANYTNKVLFLFKQDAAKLDNFRPFIPEKGTRRDALIKAHPEYTS